MVDGHSLGDLTIIPGMRVVVYGRVERLDVPDAVAVWAVDAWEPDSAQRFADGEVRVSSSGDLDVPDGAVVRVEGTWTGSAIDDAIIEVSDSPTVAYVAGSADKGSPGEAGLVRFMEVGAAVDATPAPVLASGGTDDAAWYYVLYMTPELVDIQRQSPFRVDVFAAITPVH